MQAFSFWDVDIANALIRAQKRGVKVHVLIGGDAKDDRAIPLLQKAKMPVYVDAKNGYAHNKVIVFDQTKVFTGSYNFSDRAENINRENVLIIKDRKLAKQYLENWQKWKNSEDTYLLGEAETPSK